MIRVKATQQGFLGVLREVGDEFEIDDKAAFAASWMEELKPVKSGKPAEPAE